MTSPYHPPPEITPLLITDITHQSHHATHHTIPQTWGAYEAPGASTRPFCRPRIHRGVHKAPLSSTHLSGCPQTLRGVREARNVHGDPGSSTVFSGRPRPSGRLCLCLGVHRAPLGVHRAPLGVHSAPLGVHEAPEGFMKSLRCSVSSRATGDGLHITENFSETWHSRQVKTPGTRKQYVFITYSSYLLSTQEHR